MAEDRKADTVRVSQVEHLATAIIMIRPRVAFLSEAASLLPVEDRMAGSLHLEDKTVSSPLKMVSVAKGRLHLLLTRVIRR